MFAIESFRGLSLLIEPDWRRIVRTGDHAYFEELISDLVPRAQADPEGLLKQLSELNSGPIVTGETGILDDADPKICEQLKRFVPAHGSSRPTGSSA